MNLSAYIPYARLMRLHQPAGIWLLLWPCLWSLTIASKGTPSMTMMLLFALGAVLMRGAGCIVNDMADRRFDREVERTRTRPLASGEVTMKQASILLGILLFISLLIAVMLGKAVVMWATLSLLPIGIYPFMKRISWWPQLFLGLTFNWGALMGWAAVRGQVDLPAILLYMGCVAWTLGYDTIYAHQDKADDARIGIKSTALRLGDRTKPFIALCYGVAVNFWAVAGLVSGYGPIFQLFTLLALGHFAWQIKMLELDNPDSCRQVFISNAYHLGWIVFAGCLAA